MARRFKIQLPEEPAVGSVVEHINSGNRYEHVTSSVPGEPKHGWIRQNGSNTIMYTWQELLHFGGELEDVTPEKVWKLPPVPPVDTYVTTPILALDEHQVWQIRQDDPVGGSLPYVWCPGRVTSWPEFLADHIEAKEYRPNVTPRDHIESDWRVKNEDR